MIETGYRDAQVAWVEVKEDQPVDKDQKTPGLKYPRRAMFLVIYAPRRGILEVCITFHIQFRMFIWQAVAHFGMFKCHCAKKLKIYVRYCNCYRPIYLKCIEPHAM